MGSSCRELESNKKTGFYDAAVRPVCANDSDVHLTSCCCCSAREGIIGAACKAAQHAADSSSKGSKRGHTHSEWLPSMPEACCAPLSVIVHTASEAGQGVAVAGELLLREHQEQQGMAQQAGPAAAAAAQGQAGQRQWQQAASRCSAQRPTVPASCEQLAGGCYVCGSSLSAGGQG